MNLENSPDSQEFQTATNVQENSENIDEKLKDIRKQIDDIDQQLLSLLNRRMSCSLEVGRLKKDSQSLIFQPQRELALLDKLHTDNDGPLRKDHLQNIWREIFSASRSMQRPHTVAFLGPDGTFSHIAAIEFLGHSQNLQPCQDLKEVFELIHDSTCDLGIVPLENSLKGSIGTVLDLLLKYPMQIQSELFLPVEHCLLSLADNLEEIKSVCSHPQPLGQCSLWLQVNLPNIEQIVFNSTAAAAARATQDASIAVVGNANLAYIYGLKILAKHIGNADANWTRFIVLSRKQKQNATLTQTDNSQKVKSSMIFTLKDQPGSLYNFLGVFAKKGLNLSKLESRHLENRPWQYAFFADIDGSLGADLKNLEHDLAKFCTSLQILGCYPVGEHVQPRSLEEINLGILRYE